MILLAESGSTKFDWNLIDNGRLIQSTRTEGLNPGILSRDQLVGRIQDSNELKSTRYGVKNILFFGAGCNTSSSKNLISCVLKDFFPNSDDLLVEEDTMAIVYNTSEPAVICILGKGSNNCYYNGKEIYNRIPSLGYLVMDDGSDNYYGQILLRAYFYNKMPKNIRQLFSKKISICTKSVLKRLHGSESKRTILADYAKFIVEHKYDPYIKEIIDKGITTTFENLLTPYSKELCPVPYNRHKKYVYGTWTTIR